MVDLNENTYVRDGGVEIGWRNRNRSTYVKRNEKKSERISEISVVQRRLYYIRRDVRGVCMRSVRVILLLLFLCRYSSSCRDGGGGGEK